MRSLLITNFLSVVLCSEVDKYFINYLIEDRNKVTRPFNNEMISGRIYRSFNDSRLSSQFLGEVICSIKSGPWKDWWANGKRKYNGGYVNGHKSGFWHEWDKNGILRFESLYLKGKVMQIRNCRSEVCDTSVVKKNIEIKL